MLHFSIGDRAQRDELRREVQLVKVNQTHRPVAELDRREHRAVPAEQAVRGDMDEPAVRSKRAQSFARRLAAHEHDGRRQCRGDLVYLLGNMRHRFGRDTHDEGRLMHHRRLDAAETIDARARGV